MHLYLQSLRTQSVPEICLCLLRLGCCCRKTGLLELEFLLLFALAPFSVFASRSTQLFLWLCNLLLLGFLVSIFWCCPLSDSYNPLLPQPFLFQYLLHIDLKHWTLDKRIVWLFRLRILFNLGIKVLSMRSLRCSRGHCLYFSIRNLHGF